MTVTELLVGYKRFWYSLFKWRYEANLCYKIILALSFATLTGLAAQLRIPLPWTPVPVTAQTLVVLLSGVYLGRWWGGASQCSYWLIGALGMPWGAGFNGGASWAFGPTAGYLLGFVIVALLLGHFSDRRIGLRTFIGILPLYDYHNQILECYGKEISWREVEKHR